MGDPRLPGGVRSVSRRRRVLVALAVLAAVSLALSTGCSRGPRLRAGNLKEKREKKRVLQEAQRQALEEERQRELEAQQGQEPPRATPEPQPVTAEPVPGEDPEPPAQDAQPGAMPPAAPPEPRPTVRDVPEERILPPQLQPDYSQDRCRVTLRRPDGSEVSKLLYQPLFGYMERTFKTSGGVIDHEHSMPMFRFQVGLSLHKVKFRNLDRLEFIEAPDTRTGVRLRFHFRKGRKPEEFAAEQLLGAAHPQIPVLQGLGTGGLERFPLFHIGEGPNDLRIIEVDFTP